METTAFSGIFPVVAVPFTNQGRVDEDSFSRLMAHLMSLKPSGLMIFGIASEFYKLTGKEKMHLETAFLTHTQRSDVMGIVSVTDHAWEVAQESVMAAQAAGADAINIFPPHFLHPSRAAWITHMEKLAAVASVPLIVQYAPRESGIELDPAFFAELQASYPRIAAVKVETQPPGSYIARLRAATVKLQTLVGYAGVNMPDALERGATGIQPGCSFTEVYQRFWSAWTSDRMLAAQIYSRLLPYLSMWMQNPEYIIAVEKEILYRRRIISETYCRGARVSLDHEDMTLIEGFLEEFSADLE